MDKLTKNPDTKLTLGSPRRSNSVTEKVKVEIDKKSEEDFRNTRRLSVQSAESHEVLIESNDIDRQISDLESLIQRLQDEITEMGNSADKKSEENITPTESNESKQKDRGPKKDDDPDSSDNNSHIYPIILRDVSFNLEDQSRVFADNVSTLINYVGPIDCEYETFSEIRRNFDILWGDDDYDKPHVDKYERDRKRDDDENMGNLIDELKSEIMEKMENLKDIDDGQPLNNSDDEKD